MARASVVYSPSLRRRFESLLPRTKTKQAKWSARAEAEKALSRVIFYDAPPTLNGDVLKTFKSAADTKTRTDVIVPARIEKGKEGTYAGFTVPWADRQNVKQEHLNAAWEMYYTKRVNRGEIPEKGKGLLTTEGAMLYPGEYFPYLISNMGNPETSVFLPGNPPDSMISTQTLSHAVSLRCGKEVSAQVFPDADDKLLPFASVINEANADEEYNAAYESYTSSKIVPNLQATMFFPSISVGINNQMFITGSSEILAPYGSDYERKYTPKEYVVGRATWEYFINRIYWKDKWHAEIKLNAESPTVPGGCVIYTAENTTEAEAALKQLELKFVLWAETKARSRLNQVPQCAVTFKKSNGVYTTRYIKEAEPRVFYMKNGEKKAYNQLEATSIEGAIAETLDEEVQFKPLVSIMDELGIRPSDWEWLIQRHQPKEVWDSAGVSTDVISLYEPVVFPDRLRAILQGWKAALSPPPLKLCIVKPPVFIVFDFDQCLAFRILGGEWESQDCSKLIEIGSAKETFFTSTGILTLLCDLTAAGANICIVSKGENKNATKLLIKEGETRGIGKIEFRERKFNLRSEDKTKVEIVADLMKDYASSTNIFVDDTEKEVTDMRKEYGETFHYIQANGKAETEFEERMLLSDDNIRSIRGIIKL